MSKLNKLNSNRAITLVALIITIIVMLILVGVSISVLINSDLIGTAQNAGDRTETAYGEEGQMGQITVGNTTYWSIEDYLNDRPKESIQITLSVESKATPVTAGGNVSSVTNEGVPIPTGFYYVGGTKNTGLVISDNSADLNAGADANLQGNQFVWVPVAQNQTIKIKVRSEEEITAIRVGGPDQMITTDINGNEFNPSGTKYEVEINPTINGTYAVQIIAGEEKKTELFNVSSLYYLSRIGAHQQILDAVSQLESAATANNMTADELLESGALASQYPGLTSVVEIPMYVYNAHGWSDHIDTTGNLSMPSFAASVEKYGGFYIARYEAGSANARINGQEATLVLTPVLSKKNQYPYNYISQTDAITQCESMYSATNTPAITSVTPTLTNGAAFFRTLNWLLETKVVTQAEVAEDDTSWGNYENSEFKFIGKYSTNLSGSNFTEAIILTEKKSGDKYLLGTGVTEHTKRNNIYDLVGNCEEWTTETEVSSGHVYSRGGKYYSGMLGAIYSSVCSSDSGYNDSQSFRVTLYIK